MWAPKSKWKTFFLLVSRNSNVTVILPQLIPTWKSGHAARLKLVTGFPKGGASTATKFWKYSLSDSKIPYLSRYIRWDITCSFWGLIHKFIHNFYIQHYTQKTLHRKYSPLPLTDSLQIYHSSLQNWRDQLIAPPPPVSKAANFKQWTMSTNSPKTGVRSLPQNLP